MTKKQIIAIVVIILLLLSLMVSLTIFVVLKLVTNIENNAKAGIGEKYDSEQWIASASSNSTIRSSMNRTGDEAQYKFGLMTGCESLWYIYNSDETAEVTCTYECSGGRFKVVAVAPDESVTEVESGSMYKFSSPGGRTEIKIVGDAAKDVVLDISIKSEDGIWSDDDDDTDW